MATTVAIYTGKCSCSSMLAHKMSPEYRCSLMIFFFLLPFTPHMSQLPSAGHFVSAILSFTFSFRSIETPDGRNDRKLLQHDIDQQMDQSLQKYHRKADCLILRVSPKNYLQKSKMFSEPEHTGSDN